MSEYNDEGLECIKRMTGDYLRRWKLLRDVYARKLDKGPIKQNIAFTPHDYKNHAINIYKILSDLLINTDWYDEKKLNIENLFILNVAVLLHDIVMKYHPEQRFNHSSGGREYVYNELSQIDCEFTEHEKKCISDVIYAHSDIKDENGNLMVDTIEKILNEDQSKYRSGRLGTIHVCLLAALLRLADELDVSDHRIAGYEHHKQTIGADSMSHWRKCEILFAPILSISIDSRAIYLNVNNEKILSDADIENDIEKLVEVRDKIFKELTNLNDKVFCTDKCFAGWSFSKIEFDASEEIRKRISAFYDRGNPLSATSERPFRLEVNIDNIDFKQKLSSLVLNEGFLQSGHFSLSADVRARDWIDTKSLLENRSHLSAIVREFCKIIPEGDFNIVGVDHTGLLLASAIAFKTHNSFSYVIPEKFKEYRVKPEIDLKINKGNKTILVTDVIVTGSTVLSAINEIKSKCGLLDDDFSHILCVFTRHPLVNIGIDLSLIVGKISALNNEMPIEICEKGICYFTENELKFSCKKPPISC